MGWPQWLMVMWLALFLWGGVATLVPGGKPKKDDATKRPFVDAFVVLVTWAVIPALLWWGGFWS